MADKDDFLELIFELDWARVLGAVRRGELMNRFSVNRLHAFELPLKKVHYF